MNELNKTLKSLKIVPVIEIDNAEDILAIGEQLSRHGLPVAEITFRTAAAPEAIRLLREAYPDMLIGAGTVLNEEQVILAKEAGADFIVSPGLNPKTVKACQQHDIVIIPGVNSPSLVEQALDLGLDTVKFFPAEASGGLPMLKSLLGPYGQIKVMPTGGINKNNINDYLAFPAVLACGGTWMVDKKLVNNQQWDEIGRLVKEIIDLLKSK